MTDLTLIRIRNALDNYKYLAKYGNQRERREAREAVASLIRTQSDYLACRKS